MNLKCTLSIAALLIFMTVPAFADAGCKNGKFVGSYTSPNLDVDAFGDGSSIHSFVFQLTLNSDGTANQNWTGYQDYLINLGTGSTQIGSWTCRQDGKLIVTLIQGSYFPVGVGGAGGNVAAADIQLSRHFRTTYLFSVDNNTTLTKLQSRTRQYLVSEDPTDPAAGTLRPINNTAVVYKRLTATDADLLAP